MSASTYHSITCRTGREYGTKQRKLIAGKCIERMMRVPAVFSSVAAAAEKNEGKRT
jgi:hypothetical protein